MGETRVRVRVHGPRGHADLEMLADTGATFTKIPESVARRLGIVANETVRLLLADGTQRERGLANAEIEFSGSRRAVAVIIGSESEEALLGLTSLESLRLKVNPVTQRLEPYVPIEYLTATVHF